MNFTFLTLFPDIIKPYVETSILGRAAGKNLLSFNYINLREFAKDNYGTVDDRPYSGGKGMLIKVDIAHAAINSALLSKPDIQRSDTKIILTSASGKKYTQKNSQELSKMKQVILLCGHYEGVDSRVKKYIDEEYSIGDYVLTSGEIAATVICDSIARLVDSVLPDKSAHEIESFMTVPLTEVIKIVGTDEILTKFLSQKVERLTLLEFPHFTRPELYDGEKVPDIVTSGNHKEIDRWRIQEAYKITKVMRPDLLELKNQ